jgi:hypothetical protein
MPTTTAKPVRTRCPNPKCFNDEPEATTACRYCGTDKTASSSPACAYFSGRPCECGGRGLCLDAA